MRRSQEKLGPSPRIVASLRLMLGALLLIVLGHGDAAAAGKRPAKAEPLPPAPARLWVVAPSARGPWLLRIDNEGDEPIRVPADVRLLRLEVRPLEKPKWAKRSRWARRATVCDGPKVFGLTKKFPARRELVLKPGQSFVEQFDPRLLCFGKKADALEGGAQVKPTYGWKPKPKWSRRKARPPYVADAAKRPRRYDPRRRLEAPTMVLSYAEPTAAYGANTTGLPEPDPPKPPSTKGADEGKAGSSAAKEPAGGGRDAGGAKPGSKPGAAAAAAPSKSDPAKPDPAKAAQKKLEVPDELAARLALKTSNYSDAQHGRNVVVTLKTRNEGERPQMVALRRRQLSFTVVGPDGTRKCPRRSVQHVIPPDLFRKLSHGGQVTMRVQLAELCPKDTFRRPGVYVATPTIHALETDREGRLDVLTGVASSKKPDPNKPAARPVDLADHEDATLIRVRYGDDFFYKRPPVVIPTQFFYIPR